MKLTTNYAPLFAGVEQSFTAAEADTVAEAQRRARKRTGKWSNSITSQRIPSATGQMSAVVGSPLSSARAHEKGAFIQAKKHEYLYIPQGDGTVRKVKSVRINAQPAITPAGDKFPEFMTRRMQERAR